MTFDLKQTYFNHQSDLHGIMHTYRVMHNVLLLAKEHKLAEPILKTAYCAAFIHDMARKHDGICSMHGQWAVLEKFLLFENNFKEYGLSEQNLDALKTAVKYHSLSSELEKIHPHYEVTALLKDADALDRIRLGYPGLNPKYLRMPNSIKLISVAEHNYYTTEKILCKTWIEFNEIISTNSQILPSQNIFQKMFNKSRLGK